MIAFQVNNSKGMPFWGPQKYQCPPRNFGAVIVLSAANFPRYEVFELGSEGL